MHLCEIENPQDLPNLEFPFNVRKGRPLLVAVKILRPDASKNARFVTLDWAEQEEECRFLSGIHIPYKLINSLKLMY